MHRRLTIHRRLALLLALTVIAATAACSSDSSSPNGALGLADSYLLVRYDGQPLPTPRGGAGDSALVTAGTFRRVGGDTVQVAVTTHVDGSVLTATAIGLFLARRAGASVSLTSLEDGSTESADVRAGGDTLLLHDASTTYLFARH